MLKRCSSWISLKPFCSNLVSLFPITSALFNELVAGVFDVLLVCFISALFNELVSGVFDVLLVCFISALLIGLVSGVLGVLVVCFIVVVMLVCRRRFLKSPPEGDVNDELPDYNLSLQRRFELPRAQTAIWEHNPAIIGMAYAIDGVAYI